MLNNFIVQHWSLWYSSKNKKSSWNENQHIVCTMATIEDFWHCHNQVKNLFFSYRANI